MKRVDWRGVVEETGACGVRKVGEVSNDDSICESNPDVDRRTETCAR